MQTFRQWPVYFVGRILPAAIGFGAIALYTRLLDPASFGIYALLLSTSFLVGTVGYSWLKTASLRLTATVARADEANLITTIGVAFAATSIPVFMIVTAIIRACNPSLAWTSAVLAGACAVASGWFELNVAIMQARLRVTAYGLLQLGRVIATLVASLTFIHEGFKAEALLGGFAIGNCAGFAVLGLWKDAARGRFDKQLFWQFVSFGWPSSASAASLLASTFQRYVLFATGGSAPVGIYAAASDFSQQTVGLLIGTATLAGQPLAFRARDLGDHEQLAEQLRNNARLVFGIGLPATVGLIALSGPISQIYLGPRFHVHSGTLIAISAVIMLLSGLRGSYFEQVFEIARKTRAVAINTLLRILLTIALSLLAIGRYGVVGAAVALLVAELIGLLLSIVLAKRLMQVPIPVQSLLKIAAATCVMLVAMVCIPGRATFAGLAAAVSAGVLVYGGAMMLSHLSGVRAYVGTFSVPQRSTRP
jgi:O-antigen/teichoic acid export membrane protein